MNTLKHPDAVISGMTCLDMTPIFHTPPVRNICEIFRPNSVTMVGKADMHAGGVVANTGLALQKFGVNTELNGKIGNDDLGRIVQKQLGNAKGMKVSENEETSYAICIAPPGIDRFYLHYPGVNDGYDVDDIDYENIKTAKLFHFGYPPLFPKLYKNNGKRLADVFIKAKALGATTSLDMCGVDETDESGKADWSSIIRRIIPYVDIFVPSADELCFMIDRERYQYWKMKASDRDIDSILTEEDVRPLAERMLSWGVKILLLKCGTFGLYLATNDQGHLKDMGRLFSGIKEGWSDILYHERCFEPVKVMSATGAGDTCIAAFYTSILQKRVWKQCLRYASAAGTCCVEAIDPLSGLLSFEEMDRRIAAGWRKN